MLCSMANMLQTNKVDAQCDKAATKLSWQRFTSKVANFQLLHQQLALGLEVTHLSFTEVASELIDWVAVLPFYVPLDTK